jgi:hypothetical protein
MKYDEKSKQWLASLGDLIKIRIFLGEDGFSDPKVVQTKYAVRLNLQGCDIALKGSYDTAQLAFHAASDYCQNLFEEAQQDLIKTMLKIKEPS